MNQNPMSPYSNYSPMWICNECGSSDVHTMDDAWFDPNDNYRFIEKCDTNNYDWCNDCENETTLDEVEPPDDPWGNAYGTPNYWVPPVDDEYWTVRNEQQKLWTELNECDYWNNRLGETNAND